ncbi:MAG: hypothetical protein LUH22_14825 [Bacteroides sp.]|nr:hypothetical protein [Bacteroides sp.]
MDYKYIKEVLDRYWNCQTTVEEEAELRSFFISEDVPASLQPDKDLFLYQSIQKDLKVSNGFEEKVLAQIELPVVKIRRVTLFSRFKPLFKAAAMVVVLLTAGSVIEYSLSDKSARVNSDTYEDPAAAYEEVSNVLKMLSEEINKSAELKDSLFNKEIEKPLER